MKSTVKKDISVSVKFYILNFYLSWTKRTAHDNKHYGVQIKDVVLESEFNSTRNKLKLFTSFRGGLSQGRAGLDPNKKIELDLKVPPP